MPDVFSFDPAAKTVTFQGAEGLEQARHLVEDASEPLAQLGHG